MPRIVYNEEFKTRHGFKIGHRQQKCCHTPDVYLMDNPAVILVISDTLYQILHLF